MTRLLYFLCFVLKQCAFAVLFHVSQPESAVRVQPGNSTTLQCFTPDDGHIKVFWLKFQNSSAPVFVASAQSGKTDIDIGDEFQDSSKYRLTWNQTSFSLSVLKTGQTDIAVYYCGINFYNKICFGNGTRLMFEERFNGKEVIKEKEDSYKGKQSVYIVPTLVTITVVSILFNIILCCILKKHRAGMSQTNVSQNSKTEVNYAALTFAQNQRKIKPRPKKHQEPQVIYEAVRHQKN